MPELKNASFSTRAVHAGERLPPGDYTPVATPIHPSVGYLYENMEELDGVLGATREGYVYPRYGSPTVAAFELAMADLERGEAAFGFPSGMAALHGALLAAGVRAGTAVIGALDLYGATFTLLQRLFAELGVRVRLVDINDLEQVKAAVDELHPVAIIAETISNPLLKVANVPALAELAHGCGAQLLIDNTFATPYLFNPLVHGADFSIHSATKYIGGHGDVMAGVVVTSDGNRSKLYDLNKMVGGVLGPFEAWLALRGLKTLPLRVKQQFANAVCLAEWLAGHRRIALVNYPGLAYHPQHDLARSLFEERGFGGILSFELAGHRGAQAGRAEAFAFMEALRLCLPATTLGDIYTLVLHPATASHRGLTDEEREQVGIQPGLVRLSAGVEDINDLIADLEQALAQI